MCFTLGALATAEAKNAHALRDPNAAAPAQQIEVTADKTLEWYQDQNLYVARGNAKAVRGDLTVTADLLTAHEREKPKDAKDKKTPADKKADNDAGDIDKMTAEGHVVILKPHARITGDRAVDDVDGHVIVVTGDNLRYETDKQVVTAKDSLEYWDDKKIAVARGNAVAVKGDRHVAGDVLTAEFRDTPNGSSQLYKMTAVGHVTVVTKNDVTRGDKGVYDAARDIAIVTGHVRITRPDGTELTGDVGESDFAANQSRLMNDGSGRVRALLPARTTEKASKPAATTPAPHGETQ
ncbi:MAG: LptA/OstA family protein [Alphaproteobacteria bacterium]|nr:LptA/OstA family protein [Alphaproteobacteria bacterium]